ncbi:MAG: hypothetical protein ACJ702_07410 [Nitrososphaeraceae archaeon]|jgi:hypothetical protein
MQIRRRIQEEDQGIMLVFMPLQEKKGLRYFSINKAVGKRSSTKNVPAANKPCVSFVNDHHPFL